MLRKEMQDTRKTVKDETEQMKQHYNKTMNDVLDIFEKQLTVIIIETVDKHNDNIGMIRDEVKAQTERTERQSDSMNSVEVQLEESAKREKLTQCKLI